MSASSTGDSHAPEQQDWLIHLLRQHYVSVYRLALTSLDDAKAARQIALRTFAEAYLQETRHPEALADKWLYEATLGNLRQNKNTASPAHSKPGETELMANWMVEPAIVKFNHAVDRLGVMEHRLLALVYVLGWEPARAAALLGVSQSAALAQLALFHSRLCPLLEEAAESAIPSGEFLPELPGELGASADYRAAAILQARWPAPALSEAELKALARQIQDLAMGMRQRREKAAPYRRLTTALGAAALILLCLTGGLGAWLLNAQGFGGQLQATPTATAFGAPTAFPPIAQVEPITRRSSAEDIYQRWEESATLWHSLSADAQTWRYGPLSYFGLPRAYRAQAWVLQPDQSIVLSGLLGQAPGQSYLAAHNRIFGRSAAANESFSAPWDGAVESLLPAEPLQSMIFPASSPWASRQGVFRDVQTANLAGRQAIVFDWFNPQEQREARLWLDAQTGIILRAQVYGGRDFQTLLDESVITTLNLERGEPPPALITGARLGLAQSVSSDPAFLALPPTPTPAAAPADRPSSPPDPAPPGFNPAGSSLTFQFTRDPKVSNAATDIAAQPVELVADGYNLGKTQFGLPWTLRCDRSPDGQRLAFNAGSDGAAPADDSVRWFNLSRPQLIYQPLPDLNAVSFSFAPDSRRLAVAGDGSGNLASGVYLVDIGTGESRLLFTVDEAHSLVWSPEGEFLALIGKLPDQEEAAILVLHVRTSQLAYQGEPGVIDEAPAESPITAWGMPFPVEMGGMDECAAPLLP